MTVRSTRPAGPDLLAQSRDAIAAGNAAEARRLLDQCVAERPQDPNGWNALGCLLKAQGQFEASLRCHERVIALAPKSPVGWMQAAHTQGLLGRLDRAREGFDHALRLDPANAAAWFGRAQALHALGDVRLSLQDYARVLRLQPGHLHAHSYRLVGLHMLDDVTREALLEAHRRFGERVGPARRTLAARDLSPTRRLRVAVHSPDLRTHSCAYFLEPLLQHLDPSQFELFLYADHVTEDGVSARLKPFAAVWRNFAGQPDAVVERIVLADEPDILIDLCGHGGNAVRLPVWAGRVAPVQITYLGYPDTTGVPAMDYRFTDGIADPMGDADSFATERLVRFSSVAWSYRPPEDGPVEVPDERTDGPGVTFGCFNAPQKYNDTLLRTWARVLEAVPGSRLHLKGRDFDRPDSRQRLLGWLASCGVPAARVILAPRTPTTREHLEQYGRIDVALDTFPYNGTTTTCEALWMGRPVVTLRGDRHCARVGASLLTAVGHPEWVAASAEEYVAIAASLAANAGRRRELARGLRGAMSASPLQDHVGQSARFQQALRACWRERAQQLSHSPAAA